MSNIIINNKIFISNFKNHIYSISDEKIIEISDVPSIMYHIVESIENIYPKMCTLTFKVEILEDLTLFLIKTYCMVEQSNEEKIEENINKIILLIKKNNYRNKKCTIL